jgi:hypothetical protein
MSKRLKSNRLSHLAYGEVFPKHPPIEVFNNEDGSSTPFRIKEHGRLVLDPQGKPRRFRTMAAASKLAETL